MDVTEYKVFVASPGDTIEERNFVESLGKELTENLGHDNNFTIRTIRWENDIVPSIGLDGQDVINTQVGKYDIFIGIMWKKFGTPTGRANSGTEEEFDIAHKRFTNGENLNIMWYFNKQAIPYDDINGEELEKVKNFKTKVYNLGVFWKEYYTLDEFKTNVRKHLTKEITRLNKKSEETVIKDNAAPIIKKKFADYLSDPEIIFAHSKVDRLFLEDIYVTPDLKKNSKEKKENLYKVENLNSLTNAIDVGGIKFILIGNDSIGKTSACKYIFKQYFDFGFYPIYIDGTEINENIRPERLLKELESKSEDQYDLKIPLDGDNDKVILIIDNFNKASKGKSRYWPTLVKNLENIFPNIILTGSNLMPLENTSKFNAFENFEMYSILEFGPKLRHELVNKWNNIGMERFTDVNEVYRKNDEALKQIKTIIGKNYIPSYPFYILTILQAMQSGNVQNPNYSIHGFYYELIINDALQKYIQSKEDISFYYNYLTYFSFHLFELKRKELSWENFKLFHEGYAKEHEIPAKYGAKNVLTVLTNANLLIWDGYIRIKENYIYYFFVSKFLANNINRKEYSTYVKEIISKMSKRVFRDEYSSIIMFLTHLSKDDFILDELLLNANSIFESTDAVRLEEDIKGINDLVESLPNLVLENIEVEEARGNELQEEEESERYEREYENEKINYDSFDLNENLESIDFYAKISLALKTIDILGQIAKKHWGMLNGEQKFAIVDATYKLGLRTLGFYLKMLEENSELLVDYLKEILDKRHLNDRYKIEKTLEEDASSFVFRLCFMAAFGITKRISNAIGYDNLKNTFDSVLKQNQYNSAKLIDLAIKLGYSGIPMVEIENHKGDMLNNKLSFVLLQNLVTDHMYMFDTDYKERAQVCEILEISMQHQRYISGSSKVKKS